MRESFKLTSHSFCAPKKQKQLMNIQSVSCGFLSLWASKVTNTYAKNQQQFTLRLQFIVFGLQKLMENREWEKGPRV